MDAVTLIWIRTILVYVCRPIMCKLYIYGLKFPKQLYIIYLSSKHSSAWSIIRALVQCGAVGLSIFYWWQGLQYLPVVGILQYYNATGSSNSARDMRACVWLNIPRRHCATGVLPLINAVMCPWLFPLQVGRIIMRAWRSTAVVRAVVRAVNAPCCMATASTWNYCARLGLTFGVGG